jgi:hypothetical protein
MGSYQVTKLDKLHFILQNATKMHAFLISGDNEQKIADCVDKLVIKHKLLALNYQIDTIKSVREMNSYTNLKISKPTGIIIRNIEKASPEALNAFLKNLEEPQPAIYFILTTPDVRLIIPTITSRCQLINLGKEGSIVNNEKHSLDFLSKTIGEKFIFIDSIKERESALDFINEFILGFHPSLFKRGVNIKKVARILSIAESVRQSLKLNGNIQLHLTNFIINI